MSEHRKLNIIEIILFLTNARALHLARGVSWDKKIAMEVLSKCLNNLAWNCNEGPVFHIFQSIAHCLNDKGEFVHADKDETPIFPLEYVFTHVCGEHMTWSIKNCIEHEGTPVDGDDVDVTLEWTGCVNIPDYVMDYPRPDYVFDNAFNSDAFMQPVISGQLTCYEIDGPEGTDFVDESDCGELTEFENDIHNLSVENQQKVLSALQYTNTHELENIYYIRKHENWYMCRMNAAGYMDCTDWVAFETVQECEDHLMEMYGD